MSNYYKIDEIPDATLLDRFTSWYPILLILYLWSKIKLWFKYKHK